VLKNLKFRCTLIGLTWATSLVAYAYDADNDAAAPPQTTATADSDSTNAGSQEEGAKLGEILVTARRREENIQTVPISITALSQDSIKQNNIQTFQDLQYMVPSLTATDTYSRDAPNFSIRGQGLNGQFGNIPAVEAYTNEVPIPVGFNGGLAGGPGLLFDLDNVSVLKGPQGTLFGRNTMGGAILLRTARPTDEFGGQIQATYGNYNDTEIDGAINMPIIDDTLLTRLAVNAQVRDGYTHVLGEPDHPNGFYGDNEDHWSIRGTITFRPSDIVQNDTIMSFTHYTSHGAPIILTAFNPAQAAATAYPTLAALFAQQQALGIRTGLPVDTNLVSGGYNLALQNISKVNLGENVTFRNIFGLDQLQATNTSDVDGTALSLADSILTPATRTERNYTEEAQLLGNALGGHLDWIAGAFYLDESPVGYTAFDQVNFSAPPLRPQTKNQDGSKSKALFLNGIFDLADVLSGLKFNAGVRYTWDELFTREGSVGGPFDNNTDVKDSAPTWTVGLDYQVRPDTLLYVASRRGYRAGGPNKFQSFADGSGYQPANFGPEYVTDVELGIKSDWNAGNVPIRTNVAIYDQDYSDIQVQQNILNPDNSIAVITANAAKARIWGTELEALAQLTTDFQLGVNFDYLNFKYTKFDAGVTPLSSDNTVNRPPRKYGVNARYHLPLSADIGDMAVRANWNWQDRSGVFLHFGPDNPTMPAFGLLNMSAEWNGIYGAPFDISLFGSNLLDKVYPTAVFDLYTVGFGFDSEMFGPPRMYGIRFRYHFGADAKR
jgi:iron complex outermembrane recepter protein